MSESPEFDVFISFRFKEAQTEARLLADQLKAAGLNVFCVNADPGEDLFKMISGAIRHSTVQVLMASKTYGIDTGTGFSTYQEMLWSLKKGHPFLVKMTDEYEEDATDFALLHQKFIQWYPGEPIPERLVGDIIKKVKANETKKPTRSQADASGIAISSTDTTLKAIVPGTTRVRIMDDPTRMLQLCKKHGYNWSSRVSHMNGNEYIVHDIVREGVIRVYDQTLADRGHQDGLIFVPLECVTRVQEQKVQEQQKANRKFSRNFNNGVEYKQDGKQVQILADSESTDSDLMACITEELPAGIDKLEFACNLGKKFTDTLLQELAKNIPSGLTELVLWFYPNRKFADDGIRELAKNMPSNLKNLELNFGKNVKCTDDAIKELAKNIPSNLETLHLNFLHNPNFTDAAIREFIGAIPVGCKTRVLFFKGKQWSGW